MAHPRRTIESYHTKSFKKKQAEKVDRNFGEIKSHKKICDRCGAEFEWVGREKTVRFKKARFCSRSCANHRGTGKEWEDTMKTRSMKFYRTICFSEWDKKCAICGFDKVLSVHHIDGNRKNNDVVNLIPLCPNHHTMAHTKEYKTEILEKIKIIRGIS